MSVFDRKPEDRFDVLIYRLDNMLIDRIVGEGMQYDEGFYNAEKRLATVFPRLNENYSAAIVPTRKYRVGERLLESEVC